ncbi:TMEM175 family protein [Streptomyces sp. H27-H1]|uniref:TMEM175 family protein n=1 Tax=Streptomyces sp. H27-H1 TaxID=2996461 RepID=UPI003B639926
MGRVRKGGHGAGCRQDRGLGDGLFAIVFTILVLELKVPEGRGGELSYGPLRQWPRNAAYVGGFLLVGVMWANRHTLLSRSSPVDQSLLFLNPLAPAMFGLGVIARPLTVVRAVLSSRLALVAHFLIAPSIVRRPDLHLLRRRGRAAGNRERPQEVAAGPYGRSPRPSRLMDLAGRGGGPDGSRSPAGGIQQGNLRIDRRTDLAPI